MIVTARTFEDVAGAVYEDHMAEHLEGEWGSSAADYVDDFHFAPCCGLTSS